MRLKFRLQSTARCFILVSSVILSAFAFLTASEHILVPKWQSVVPDTGSISLLSNWTLHSDDGAYFDIPATVPGDVLTDLMRAGIIDNPYFNRNFLEQSHVWMGTDANASNSERSRTRTWIYTTEFELQSSNSPTTSYLLVVEGMKMGAAILVNGIPIEPSVTDQFLRYIFPLNSSILEGTRNRNGLHELTVAFNPKINTDGRFMACSGGWDWAPYTRSLDDRGSRVFTFGITDNIYVVAVEEFYIHSVTARVHYLGLPPREPMLTGAVSGFIAKVDVHLAFLTDDRRSPNKSCLVVSSNFTKREITRYFDHLDEKVTIMLAADGQEVQLWWPNGMGKQPLYSVDVSIQKLGCNSSNALTIRKNVGFRTVGLVTANDTDYEEWKSMIDTDREGTGSIGMMFRINGAIVSARGANVIPMDELEGRWSDEGHVRMVESAAAAHMNMLRVWGGGAILPLSFYESCDRNGLLLYHDMMFVGEQNHSAIENPMIEAEIRHICRKLMSHPSIVLWSGCNECTYFGGSMSVYERFVMKVVAEEDTSRPMWPSSPSKCGWERGVSTVDGKPNGKPLRLRADNDPLCNVLEQHGPYQQGISVQFPGVNGMNLTNTFETHLPPTLSSNDDVQPGLHNTFTSEVGSSVYSSFESMSVMLPNTAWNVHGGTFPDSCRPRFGNENECTGINAMAERNYPCDSRIEAFFGVESLVNTVGADLFSRQLYECMIAQALWMKGQMEIMRSSNSFGVLFWQLNEIWPTGGWGAIEYGPSRYLDGQLVGGRWKPLMYLLKQSLFRDVIVACGAHNQCYVRNDEVIKGDVIVTFEAWRFNDSSPSQTMTKQFVWKSSLELVQRFTLPSNMTCDSDVVLISSARVGEPSYSAFLWKAPLDLDGLFQPVQFDMNVYADEQDRSIVLETRSDRLALYVFFSSSAAVGYFSENAFHLKPFTLKKIRYSFLDKNEMVPVEDFVRSLRVEHLGRKVEINIVKIEAQWSQPS